MSIESFKHDRETRPLIPSSEEAGMEAASPAVESGPDVKEFPKNPVVSRGQDPELFWMEKYGNDDRDDILKVDIRSLYRHEHIAPESLIKGLYRMKEAPSKQLGLAEMFGDGPAMEELEKVGSYYEHQDGWRNRLIQGDSLLVMTSLLEREGMAGKVQCIYIDPPYGIKYGSNWQMRLNNRNVKDGSDDDLSGEPEQIKAYRDTWELGIHSYLSYLRDRLLVARDLLADSGACFVQISDENVHLVRCLMDELFGSDNFVSMITFAKTTGKGGRFIDETSDYILFYAKDLNALRGKYRQAYLEKELGGDGAREYRYLMKLDGTWREIGKREFLDTQKLLKEGRVFSHDNFTSQTGSETTRFSFELDGEEILPPSTGGWKTNATGVERLKAQKRLIRIGRTPRYVRYFDDFPIYPLANHWNDTRISGFADSKSYVVQTLGLVVQRCILMTTDPGDLVLDPTCGSGTTAFVAEQWGRRWITIDTSRIAVNVAKERLLTATYPYYTLHDEQGGDVRQGFRYRKIPHVMLKSISGDEPVEEATLYDQPEVNNTKLRVAGPFTVETLQNFEPVSPEALDRRVPEAEELEKFEERVFEHLKAAGVKTGVKEECAVFTRVQPVNSAYLHAEGFYHTEKGERKAYLHIGPKFGTVSKQAVNEAVKECRSRGDADWLLILGFQFESDIANQSVTTSVGNFMVTKNRMHDDLMQDGLLKKDKKAASFVTIGEPDIRLLPKDGSVQVEICGLDIYDPIHDEVKARDVADIAYWMVDDDYDGSNFLVRQVFFCGGDKDEFDKWKKGLSSIAMRRAKKDAEKELKIEIDHDAFNRLYGHKSHPIEATPGRKIAVRVISQFGEESTKVLEV